MSHDPSVCAAVRNRHRGKRNRQRATKMCVGKRRLAIITMRLLLIIFFFRLRVSTRNTVQRTFTHIAVLVVCIVYVVCCVV